MWWVEISWAIKYSFSWKQNGIILPKVIQRISTVTTEQPTFTSAQSPVFAKGLGSAASTLLPRIFIFTCCSTWIVPKCMVLYEGWLLWDNPQHSGNNNSCISREAGYLMGPALHSCVQLEQYLVYLPCCEAICCCGDAGMSLLFDALNALKVIRRGLGWLCGQNRQRNCCLQFQQWRTEHIRGTWSLLSLEKPFPSLLISHANATRALARGPVPEQRPGGDTTCWPGRRAVDWTPPVARRRQGVGTGTN